MKITPVNNQVLIRRRAADQRTASGLFIPTTAQANSSEGTVLAVGRGKMLASGVFVEPVIKQGDQVLFEKYSEKEIEVDGEKLVMVDADRVIAVLEK